MLKRHGIIQQESRRVKPQRLKSSLCSPIAVHMVVTPGSSTAAGFKTKSIAASVGSQEGSAGRAPTQPARRLGAGSLPRCQAISVQASGRRLAARCWVASRPSPARASQPFEPKSESRLRWKMDRSLSLIQSSLPAARAGRGLCTRPVEHPSCRVTDPVAHGPVPVTTALLLAALKAALVRKASIVSQKAVTEASWASAVTMSARCLRPVSLHRPHL